LRALAGARMRILAFLAAWTVLAQPAFALSIESAPALPSLAAPPPGVTTWDTLGKASVTFGEELGQETVTTLIPPEIEALDGTTVRLMGFMFPIDAEPEPRRFLLVEYPADCPFCLAGTVEPSRMVEVEAGRPIPWHDEAVLVAGRLEVVRDDADGLVYRLHEARLAE
jgi:uncharacterized protein